MSAKLLQVRVSKERRARWKHAMAPGITLSEMARRLFDSVVESSWEHEVLQVARAIADCETTADRSAGFSRLARVILSASVPLSASGSGADVAGDGPPEPDMSLVGEDVSSGNVKPT